jgi:hypothetical protein
MLKNTKQNEPQKKSPKPMTYSPVLPFRGRGFTRIPELIMIALN